MANTELGKAYVQIVPSADGIGNGIATALQPGAKSAGKAAGTTVGKTMGNTISTVGKKFMKVGGIATALSVPVINGIKDAMGAYEVQATAETKLTEIYKTRMGASDAAVESTKKLASALQQEGIIGDEVALSGAQQLATFAKYPSTINTLLPSMENLLAQQKGVNATTDDAVNIGNLMGKVMQGQTGALKRVGISFTEAQEKVLKYGTEEEKAATLAEVINSNVGNMNQELAKTPAGQMQQLSNTLGDIKEEIGAALAPALAQVAQYVSKNIVPMIEKIVKFVQEHPIIGKIAIAIAGLLAVGGPLLLMLGSIMTIVPMLASGFSLLLGPVGLVIAAIAAAIAIGVLLYKHWDTIKQKASEVWGAIKNIFITAWDAIKNIFITAWNGIVEFFTGAVKGLADMIKRAWNGITDFFRKSIEGWRLLFVAVWNKIKEIFITAAQAIKEAVIIAWGAIKNVFVGIWNGIVTAVTTVWNLYKRFLTAEFNGIKTIVKTVFGWIAKWLDMTWGNLFRGAKKVWDNIKSAMVKPIEKARDAIKKIVEKIKKFFDFKVSLPNIKLPHFTIDPPGWKLSDLLHGVIPSLDIDWYAKGGIMTKPTVFGGGEAGTEGIIPLDPFWQRLDAMADNIVNGVATVAAAGAGGYGDVHLDVYLYPNSTKMMEETVKMYDKGKKILG